MRVLPLAFLILGLFSPALQATEVDVSPCHLTNMENMELPNSLIIEGDKVQELLNKTGLTSEELLKKLVPIASRSAKPEISNFYVGAAVLGKSGAIYLGANLEFKDMPLHATVHAEQFAITNARNFGEEEIKAIAISAPPCGHCRQFMNELAEKENIDIFISDEPAQKLATLLPHSFGPSDLGLTGGMMTISSDHFFTLEYSSHSQALRAAYNSYAPYSSAKSGVALKTHEGKIYSGSYLENAGFNPSLSPLQGALISLISNGGNYSQIKEALLIESNLAKISQKVATKELLKKIAPKAKFSLKNHTFE